MGLIPNHDKQLMRGYDAGWDKADDFQNYFEACDMDQLIYEYLKNRDNYLLALEIVDPKDNLGFPDNIEETTQKQFEALVLAVKFSPELMDDLEEQEYLGFDSNQPDNDDDRDR